MSLDTLKPKVAKLIEKAQRGAQDSTGIILSGFAGVYYLPTVADLRSLPGDPTNPNKGNSLHFAYRFWNYSTVARNGYYVSLKTVYLPDWISAFAISMFYNCGQLVDVYGDFSNVEMVSSNAFFGCTKLPQIPYMPNVNRIDANAFCNCKALTEVALPSTITSIANNAFSGCTNLLNIYVPWAEGAVANAPWGATNATIHYNHNAEV